MDLINCFHDFTEMKTELHALVWNKNKTNTNEKLRYIVGTYNPRTLKLRIYVDARIVFTLSSQFALCLKTLRPSSLHNSMLQNS